MQCIYSIVFVSILAEKLYASSIGKQSGAFYGNNDEVSSYYCADKTTTPYMLLCLEQLKYGQIILTRILPFLMHAKS